MKKDKLNKRDLYLTPAIAWQGYNLAYDIAEFCKQEEMNGADTVDFMVQFLLPLSKSILEEARTRKSNE